MDFGLNEAQQLLQRNAREFLEAECPITYVREMEADPRGYSEDMWRKFADLGWLGLTMPERFGGSGGNFLDLTVLLEEMGRALVPGPLFSHVVLGEYSLLFTASEEQQARLLPAAVQGTKRLTLALTEAAGRYEPEAIAVRAEQQQDAYTLSGSKWYVLDADGADTVLVAARSYASGAAEQAIGLFEVPIETPGVQWEALHTMAGDKQYALTFEQVSLPASQVIGAPHQAWPALQRVLDHAAVAKCAELVGAAQKLLELTVEYAKMRVQFGRPIGSFQAVQHLCTDMLTDLDGARLITAEAAWKLSEGLPAGKEVAMAKAWSSEACRRVSASGHQIHGGVSFMKEHDMQLYFRRIKAAEAFYGGPDYHYDRVTQALLA